MKKVTILLIMLFGIANAFSQSNLERNDDYTKDQYNPTIIYDYALAFTVSYLKWSDSSTFKNSPPPIVTGYGFYSDSLSKVFNGKTFYAMGNDYYIIESWADYYYWFTKKYWYKFKNPELYEMYYLANNDYGMASYIVSRYFLGKYYPSYILLDFHDLKILANRLADEKYFADQRRKLKEFEKELTESVATHDDLRANKDQDQQKNMIEFRNFEQFQNKEQQTTNTDQVLIEKLD
jgi:hypothetical protein